MTCVSFDTRKLVLPIKIFKLSLQHFNFTSVTTCAIRNIEDTKLIPVTKIKLVICNSGTRIMNPAHRNKI